MVTALARLAERAAEHATLVMTGRSHNVAAQATTMGKRFANAGEELLQALAPGRGAARPLPAARHQGPGRHPAGHARPARLAREGRRSSRRRSPRHLGFEATLTNVGQVYPRSLDLDVVAALVQAGAGPASLATTIRLMAGLELATEGFQPGQVGSSAMPHKMNSRSCERINGLLVVLRGHLSMVGELAGDQWNEGDVSCSVVRRVALPDAFLAADGLFETFLTVLDDFGAYPAVVRAGARALPAVPHHHQGAHGRGARRRRPGGRPRGDQGARGGGRAGDARAGRRRQRPARPPGRRRPAAARPRRRSTRAVGEPLSFVGTAEAQVQAFVDQVARGRGPPPGRRRVPPRADPLAPLPSAA